ncbi:MAG: hypothetical protein A2066_18850 [Bacteroidetes bacterium GWB2_41_8]|nr:MAG: hypothetical protein A2066_18850 [Bacteroidetes bacterium GWB2_41_8]
MDFQIISVIVNALLGGGLIFQFFTVKALRNKANAEAEGAKASAESTELDNVDKAIKIWREMAEQLKNELQESRAKYMEVGKQVDDLGKQVNKLTTASNKILKMLDLIKHDNLEKVIEQIKDEINGKVN